MRRRLRRVVLVFAVWELVFETRFLTLAALTPAAMRRRDEMVAAVHAALADAQAELAQSA